MKKMNLISFIAIVLAIVGLALLRVTGMTVHIIISLLALAVMVFCAVKGKKYWKKPALEIGYRAAFLVALLTGIVMLAAHLSDAVSIIHKIFAAVFAVLYLINFVVFQLAEKK